MHTEPAIELPGTLLHRYERGMPGKTAKDNISVSSAQAVTVARKQCMTNCVAERQTSKLMLVASDSGLMGLVKMTLREVTLVGFPE